MATSVVAIVLSCVLSNNRTMNLMYTCPCVLKDLRIRIGSSTVPRGQFRNAHSSCVVVRCPDVGIQFNAWVDNGHGQKLLYVLASRVDKKRTKRGLFISSLPPSSGVRWAARRPRWREALSSSLFLCIPTGVRRGGRSCLRASIARTAAPTPRKKWRSTCTVALVCVRCSVSTLLFDVQFRISRHHLPSVRPRRPPLDLYRVSRSSWIFWHPSFLCHGSSDPAHITHVEQAMCQVLVDV